MPASSMTRIPVSGPLRCSVNIRFLRHAHGPLADDALVLQHADLGVLEPADVAQHLGVVLTQRRRRHRPPPFDRAVSERYGTHGDPPRNRMVELLVETAGAELRVHEPEAG